MSQLVLTEELLSSEAWLQVEYRGDTFHLSLTLNGGNDTIPATQGGADGFADWDTYRQEGDSWIRLAGGPLDWNPEGSTLTVDYPLSSLETKQGFTPSGGESIIIQTAATSWDNDPESWRAPVGSVVFEYRDQAVFQDGATLVVPGGSSDELRFSTPNPVRFSNGEATTFHWSVEALNPTTQAITAELRLDGSDDATPRIPAAITVDAESNKTFDVFLTVPFVHLHGGSRELVISSPATSNSLTLRIDYPVIPQPAGHHPRIYLHASHADNQLQLQRDTWLNTVEDDETDSGLAAAYTSQRECSTGADGVAWNYPLSPGLGIGLRSIPNRPATLEMVLVAESLAPAGLIEAGFLLYDTGTGIEEATIDATASTAIDQLASGTSQSIELDVPWSIPDTPYQPGTNLGLIITYCPDAGQEVATAVYMARDFAPALQIAPGATAVLPLLDYSASQELETSTATGVSILGDEPASAAPGSTVVWNLELTSQFPGTYQVSMIGSNRESVIASDTDLLDLSMTPAPWRVAVAAPENAAAGDEIEVIVIVESTEDASRSASARLTILIDPSSERNDAEEASRIGAVQEDSPSAFMLLPIVLAVLVRRKLIRV